MNALQANRTACVTIASKIANDGDEIENDMVSATDEDDLMAILSHLEILERNARRMRDMLRATLEGRAL
jgi:hypothetical protein